MFDTPLIINLFLLASLSVCLLTLRMSINIKHLYLFFIHYRHQRIFLNSDPPPPFVKFNKNLRPPVCFDSPPPFIRHLRVGSK